MTGGGPDVSEAASRAARAVLAAIVVVVAFAPPETRGEGALAIAILGGSLATVVVLGGTAVARASVGVAVGAVAIGTLVLAEAPGPAVPRVATIVAAVTLGCFASACSRGASDYRRLTWWMTAAGAIPATHAIWQAIAGLERQASSLDPRWADLRGGELIARLEAGRAFAAFPTPAALGCWIAMTLPVTAMLARRASGSIRGLASALAVVQVAGLIATRSVTAGLALGVAIALASLRGRREARRLWLVLAIVAAVVVGAALALRKSEVLGGGGGPLDLRLRNARAAWEMTLDRPWTGVGVGGFGEAYAAYRQPDDNETRYAHDLPLQATAELGLPLGVAASVAFFVLFVGPVLRRETSPGSERTAIAVGLAAFAVHNLVDFTALLPSFALAAAVLRGRIDLASSDPARPPTRPGLAAAVLVAMAFAALAVLALDGLGRDARWRSVALSVEGETEAAEGAAERSVRLAPWDPNNAVRAAEAVLGRPAADLDDALALADHAIAMSPRSIPGRRVRSVVREREGDLPGAWTDAVVAAEAYPSSQPHRARSDRLGEVVRSWVERRP